MSIDSAIEGAVKRDRIVVLGALSIVVVISWAYVLAGAGMNMSAFEMTRMASGNEGMDMMMPAVWDIGYAGPMQMPLARRASGPTAVRAHSARS